MIIENIDSINELYNSFLKIKKLGYIDGINQRSKGNVGLTFENILGKENDNFQIADFNGIEIKVQNQFNSKILRFFSLVPSNSFGIQVKRLRHTYGSEDSIFKGVKNLQGFVSTASKSTIQSGYKFQLELNYLEEKLYLLIFDKDCILIERSIYWDFDDLIKTVERKLNILAIVNFNTRILNGKNQFHYSNITFYKAKSIVVFFKLIELGKIKINFDLGIYRSGLKKGKEHDNGIFFYLNNNDFRKLYNKINF